MKRTGLTLVEVVAALTLLATVAASVLVAQRRSMRLVHQTERRREASQFVETLLNQWILEKTPLDTPDQGFQADHRWMWKRQVERQHIAVGQGLGTQSEMLRIRLTVLDNESQSSQPTPLSAVEWLEPIPRNTR